MAFYDEKHVMVEGIIVWDGVTQPETDTLVGKPKHSIKLVIQPGSPDIAELQQIADNELRAGDFKGVLPNGGKMPLGTATAAEFSGLFPGYTVINAGTYNGAPQVFDLNGQQLQAMQYGPQLYPGARVKLLVHAYTYNNKSKGVALGLDGLQIVDATLPRLQIGGGIDAAKAFGGGGAAPTPAPTPAPAPAPAAAPAAAPTPNTGFLNPEPRYEVGGQVYTKAQLLASGWNEEQIAAQAKPVQ